ncbi:WD repeat-containing protein 7 [Mortierella sp. 14UC]|nr:WD repeat-containing protein 7 [Mortierella sp. 14UC]
MASASLSIPIAFWSQNAPTATISATLACEGYVVAGLEEGHIWVFKATCGPTNAQPPAAGPPTDVVSLEPYTLLVGHSSRITALQSMHVEGDTKATCEWILISASEDGEVKKWNLVDGRCLQSNPYAFIGVPTYLGVINTVEKTASGPKFILCAGLSNEACILDSTSLEVVRVWGGHQDWVYCTVLPGDDQHQSRILSVSADCKLSLWIFDTASLAVVKSKVYEICSKTSDCIVSLVARHQDSSWAMLVTRSNVQSGHVFYYSLAELQQRDSHPRVDVLEHSAMEPRFEVSGSESSATAEGLHYSSANLLGFNSDQVPGKGNSVHGALVQWRSNKVLTSPSVTFSVMLNDILVALGHDSGDIRICPVDEALLGLASAFTDKHSKETTVLKGHIGPISSIFTTDELMERSFILTGGKDCSARIWNIESGTEVACFNNHSRPVTHFLQVPDDVNSRVKRSVISIAEDHSIAIISIEEMSCIYLFGGYEHALVSIQWRPPEDYIVLWHADETAFVWQMQTGHLDRIVKGETARAIMADSRWKIWFESDPASRGDES